MSRLLDAGGRPVAAEVPAVDEIKLRNLVAVRTEMHRREPTGLPRRPGASDWIFFRGKLAHSATVAEQEAIARLWTADRSDRGVGGAHGITTLDREPERGGDLLGILERSYRRLMR